MPCERVKKPHNKIFYYFQIKSINNQKVKRTDLRVGTNYFIFVISTE